MAASIVLDNLISSLISTATNDVGSSTTLNRDSILANILKPDKLKVASTKTVHTLLLVRTNDNITKSSTIFKNEHSVFLAAFALARALDAAVVANPLGVEDLALLEVLGSAEGLGARGFGDAACVAEAGHGGGERGEECEKAGGVHFGGVEDCRVLS